MLLSFATDSFVRLRAADGDDGHGNTEPDWTAVDEQTDDGALIEGCIIEPASTAEYLVGRDTTLIQWVCTAPADSDVLATDRARYRGKVYLIDGEPAYQRSPTGALDHLTILFKRWEG